MKKLMLGLVAAFAVTAFAAPSVKIDKVETANPWVGDEGKITVDYSLVGIDAETKYKVVFDVTADGKTASVTNGWAILSEGQQSQKEIDTAELFGGETVAKDAEVKISLIVEFGGVQLWEGGPFFAECNVGATKPEEYGWYFWWGDTVGYTNNGSGASSKWVSVVDVKTTISFDNSAPANSTYGKNASELESGGWIDNGNLVSTNDAATVKLGAPWRMMTDAELQMFTEKSDGKKVCNWTWTERNGVKGYLVTGAKDGYEDKSIFLPAAGKGSGSALSGTGLGGHYCSSTPTPDSSSDAQDLYFYQSSFFRGSASRYNGYPVRPVRGSAEESSGGGETVVATADADFWLGPGCESCPWAIGEGVTAYIKDRGLYLLGEGDVAEAPWAEYDDELDGIGPLSRSITIPASVLTTLPITVTGGAEPSGAVSGAEPETVRIVDGKVLLGVSVCTNGDVTAATEDWEPAAIEEAQVEEDGTVTLTVPATAEKGFMILKSKGAAPSDNNAANKVIEDR